MYLLTLMVCGFYLKSIFNNLCYACIYVIVDKRLGEFCKDKSNSVMMDLNISIASWHAVIALNIHTHVSQV